MNKWFLMSLLVAGSRCAATTNEIVVTATRGDAAPQTVPAAVTVMDEQTLEIWRSANTEDLFRSIAGVDIQGSGLPGQMVRLNMRGLTSGYQTQRVLVLVDGRRLNDPYQGNVEFGLLPMGLLSRVEVVKGPASALYGSNAEGGVIQFFTQRPESGSFGRLSGAYGTYHTREGRFELGEGNERGDYALTIGGEATDGYRRRASGEALDWKAWHGDLQGGIRLRDDLSLRLSGGGYSGEGRDDSADRRAQRNYQMGVLEWKPEGPAGVVSTVRLYRNGFRDRYDWVYPGVGLYQQETWVAESAASGWLNPWNQVTLGAEWRRDGVLVEEVAEDMDKASDNTGVFVQHRADGAMVGVTWGLRYDYAHDYGGFWSPRAGLMFHLIPDLDLYLSAHRAHQAPSLSDRYVQVVYNGFEFVGNPDLKPEALTSWEGGLRWRAPAGFSLQASSFYQTMKDSFDFVLTPDGVFRNYNASRATLWGIETEGRWTFGKGFSLQGALSYTDGQYDEMPIPETTGKRIPYLAPWKASCGLEYRTTRSDVHALRLRYVDRRYADAQNRVPLDSHVVLDWNSRICLSRRLFATLRLYNLFDTDYEELPGIPQPGFRIMAGFEAILF